MTGAMFCAAVGICILAAVGHPLGWGLLALAAIHVGVERWAER